ncbi:hypothetical protein [Lysobacter gummosus]|uniref:hypothetical protein n=1 Tax=Lysobacter gummosus TaxID=262324 RepID=UPI00363B53F3
MRPGRKSRPIPAGHAPTTASPPPDLYRSKSRIDSRAGNRQAGGRAGVGRRICVFGRLPRRRRTSALDRAFRRRSPHEGRALPPIGRLRAERGRTDPPCTSCCNATAGRVEWRTPFFHPARTCAGLSSRSTHGSGPRSHRQEPAARAQRHHRNPEGRRAGQVRGR